MLDFVNNLLVELKNLLGKKILFDSHCHLNAKEYDQDRSKVISRSKDKGIEVIIDIATDIEASEKSIQLADAFKESVYASVGIDPEILIPNSDLFDKSIFELGDKEFERWLEEIYQTLLKLARDPRVILIGETGIDNYWLENNQTISQEDKHKSLERQKRLFQQHIKILKELKKPMSIHSRNAIDLCLELLHDDQVEKKQAIFHSLTPDTTDDISSFEHKVSQILKRGYFIGVNGIVTFRNAEMIRKTYNKILKEEFFVFGENKINQKTLEQKLDFLYKNNFILETDGPFLAPEGHRGERNEPGFLMEVLN